MALPATLNPIQLLRKIAESVSGGIGGGSAVTGPGTAAAAARTTLASDDPAVATLGAISGAKVVTDANGTIQQYLRGLVTLIAAQAAYLDGLEGFVDGLEALITSSNTKLDTAHTDLAALLARTTAATGAQSSVSGSASDVTILASNANRKGGTIYNDSTAILYLLFASGTSSNTNFSVPLQPYDWLDQIPAGYTGVIKGIWTAANGNARVTEFTA